MKQGKREIMKITLYKFETKTNLIPVWYCLKVHGLAVNIHVFNVYPRPFLINRVFNLFFDFVEHDLSLGRFLFHRRRMWLLIEFFLGKF
jgi:hypothetical protein